MLQRYVGVPLGNPFFFGPIFLGKGLGCRRVEPRALAHRVRPAGSGALAETGGPNRKLFL